MSQKDKKIIKIIGGLPLNVDKEIYIKDNPQFVVYEGESINQKLKDLGSSYDEVALTKEKVEKDKKKKETHEIKQPKK